MSGSNPELGRFMQTDPLGQQIEGIKLSAEQTALYGDAAPETFSSSELNLYRYCNNDPVNGSDPFGLDFTDNMPARPVERIDLHNIGRTFAAVDVNPIKQDDGSFKLRLDVTIVDRQVADKIFWHGKWVVRTDAQKAATREHEEVEHSTDWRGFHDAKQKDIPNTPFPTKGAAKETAKRLAKELRQAAREANKKFEKHQPASRWDQLLRRERP